MGVSKFLGYLFSIAGLLIMNISAVLAERLDDAETIFAWAESNYGDFFSPSDVDTEFANDWYYRFYAETNTYIGINNQNEVYVLGDILGGLVFIDSSAALLAMIEPISTPPVSSECVATVLPLVNTIASYQSTDLIANSQSSNVIKYLIVNKLQTKTQQTTQLQVSGVQTVTELENTLNYHQEEDFLYLDSVISNTVVTASIPGLPVNTSIVQVTVTNTPAILTGPADSLCQGQSWITTASTQNIVTVTTINGANAPAETTVSQLPALNVVVEDVNKPITTPAGTFHVVVIRSELPDGGYALEHIATEWGGSVLLEVYNANDVLQNKTELVNLQ